MDTQSTQRKNEFKLLANLAKFFANLAVEKKTI